MGKTGRIYALLFTLIIVIPCLTSLTANPANAQTVPKPSAPEFTVKLVDNSYDVPATYSTDQYTGEKVLVEPAHHVDNRTFELSIKNQPYTYSNGSTFRVYYDVRTGGHFGGGVDLYYPSDWLLGLDGEERGPFISAGTPMQSNSDYTIVSLSAVNPPHSAYNNDNYPPNAKVDFQVKAMIGHDSQAWGYEHIGGQRTSGPAVAVAAESDWSSIQTIDLANGSVSVSTSSSPMVSSPEATVPELFSFALIPLIVSILAIALILRHRKTKN
jgi:hypothetical protein